MFFSAIRTTKTGIPRKQVYTDEDVNTIVQNYLKSKERKLSLLK